MVWGDVTLTEVIMNHKHQATEEAWADIQGFSGIYQVSNAGRIRSITRKDALNRVRRGRALKLDYGKKGHPVVPFCKDGKESRHSVSRLVAAAFLKLPCDINKLFIRYIDGNASNVASDNLSYEYKNEQAVERLAKINRKEVILIKGDEEIRCQSIKEANRVLGLKASCYGARQSKQFTAGGGQGKKRKGYEVIDAPHQITDLTLDRDSIQNQV